MLAFDYAFFLHVLPCLNEAASIAINIRKIANIFPGKNLNRNNSPKHGRKEGL